MFHWEAAVVGVGYGLPVLSCFLFFFSSQVTAELRWTARGINKEVEHKSGRLKMERRRAQGTRCVGRDLLNSV